MEEDFKYFKESVLEEIIKRGISKVRANNLYEMSGLDERLRKNPDYVLHYNIEYWATWVTR